jgi:DNA repair protein RAD5
VQLGFTHIRRLSPHVTPAILQKQEPCFRAVVFSQFTSFLNLIEVALRREHFEQYRFDGTMDVKKRNEAISGFKASSNGPKVLIISLKAGGE